MQNSNYRLVTLSRPLPSIFFLTRGNEVELSSFTIQSDTVYAMYIIYSFVCLFVFAAIMNLFEDASLHSRRQEGIGKKRKMERDWGERLPPFPFPLFSRFSPPPPSPSPLCVYHAGYEDAKGSTDSFKLKQTCLNILACTVLSTATKKN